MKKAKIIIAAVVSLLLLVIILQNTQAVETRLLFVKITMPRALLLVVTFAIGFAVGTLVTISFAGKIRRKESVK